MSSSARGGGENGGERRAGLARRAWQALVVIVLWRVAGLRRGRERSQELEDPSRRQAGSAPWAERLLLGLFGLIALAGAGFVALFVLDPNTQLLGLALGAALALAAAALLIAGRWLVPQETEVEDRPRLADEREVEQVAEHARAGVEGITRRRLLAGAAGAAGLGVTAAVAIPVVALGPGIEDQLRRTPWHAGRALVDERGKPILADAVSEGSFVTAFAQNADKENLGSPVVVVRVDPATLRLPAERAGWAPQGIVAYSKICTHAACAISLYRSPLSPTTQSRGPALVCPCHYSTFDVLDGGGVEFGPAGRPLPQLPLRIDAAGALRAGGPLSGPVGPSWFEDRS
jgi:ubiquinol-cytochrome c reductase iron-sulfur subunit